MALRPQPITFRMGSDGWGVLRNAENGGIWWGGCRRSEELRSLSKNQYVNVIGRGPRLSDPNRLHFGWGGQLRCGRHGACDYIFRPPLPITYYTQDVRRLADLLVLALETVVDFLQISWLPPESPHIIPYPPGSIHPHPTISDHIRHYPSLSDPPHRRRPCHIKLGGPENVSGFETHRELSIIASSAPRAFDPFRPRRGPSTPNDPSGSFRSSSIPPGPIS